MKIQAVLLTSVAAILAACGGGSDGGSSNGSNGGNGSGGNTGGGIQESLAEASEDYRKFKEQTRGIDYIQNSAASGKETYRGQAYAVTSFTRESITGDFTMEADFDRGVVNGDMRNIVGIALSQDGASELRNPPANLDVDGKIDLITAVASSLERNGESYDGTLVIESGSMGNDGSANGFLNGDLVRGSNQETLDVRATFNGGFIDDDGNGNDPDRFDAILGGVVENEAGDLDDISGAIFSESD